MVATFDSSASSASVVRAIYGANTGLYASNFENFGPNAKSLAVDPVSNELYVYTYSPVSGARQISVCAAHASGNVQPTRVIKGALTQIGAPGDLNSKIAVSADGRLYVAEANNRILVFAPGVSGDVASAQIISGATAAGQSVPQGADWCAFLQLPMKEMARIPKCCRSVTGNDFGFGPPGEAFEKTGVILRKAEDVRSTFLPTYAQDKSQQQVLRFAQDDIWEFRQGCKRGAGQ